MKDKLNVLKQVAHTLNQAGVMWALVVQFYFI